MIPKGGKSVHITFRNSYTATPKIIVTADTFASYRVTGKSAFGFTIETQTPVDESTSFDWIAIMVQGAGTIVAPENP